jgi:hypothetical protein
MKVNSLGSAVFSRVRESSIFSPFRLWASLRDAHRERLFVLRRAAALGLETLDLRTLRKSIGKPDADTFFILGSGASVEDLNHGDFETIRREVSVGINAWALHHFVPDLYSYEPGAENEGSHYKTMPLLNRSDVLDALPHILFLKPRTQFEAEQLNQIPTALLQRTYLYGRFHPFTRSASNLARDLGHILDHLGNRNDPVLPDSGASVTRMACLGILMGFRHIVFVGVDLNNTEYFWERNPSHLFKFGLHEFVSGQTSNTHETMSRAGRRFLVTEMVTAIGDYCQKRDVSISVASNRSVLREDLPLYVFELE